MIYQSPLQIPDVLDEKFIITINDAFYTIDEIGKIEVSLTTHNKQYEQIDLRKYLAYQKIMYIDTEEIKSLDSFRVNIKIEGCVRLEYWELISRVENNHKGISVTKEPSRCPSCGSLLHGEINSIYCFNSQCPAKIKITIKRYLLLATREKWTQLELQVIDKLIAMGRIQSVFDLYTLTLQEIESSWHYESKELTNANDLLTKIIGTKGTISIYNFLHSLNVPMNDQWYISKETLERDIPNMDVFITWLSEAEKNKEHPIETYMTIETYSEILEYLYQDQNRQIWQQLNDLKVFKE